MIADTALVKHLRAQVTPLPVSLRCRGGVWGSSKTISRCVWLPVPASMGHHHTQASMDDIRVFCTRLPQQAAPPAHSQYVLLVSTPAHLRPGLIS
jgi:hypothetical protein